MDAHKKAADFKLETRPPASRSLSKTTPQERLAQCCKLQGSKAIRAVVPDTEDAVAEDGGVSIAGASADPDTWDSAAGELLVKLRAGEGELVEEMPARFRQLAFAKRRF